jgi:hypothetical protein
MTAINTYAYRVRNLFVSYFIVLAFVLTANLLPTLAGGVGTQITSLS